MNEKIIKQIDAVIKTLDTIFVCGEGNCDKISGCIKVLRQTSQELAAADNETTA